MNATMDFQADRIAAGSRWERLAPIFTLILLAPGIAEVSSGATRLSFIFVLIPEMMVWGCGALLIRELVRRWHGGWTSMLLMGFGLSIAEEFIIQQTSVAPLPWVAQPAYGRIWGVNLIYFLFMLGFESVLVVVVPVQLTELMFPERREKPWLTGTGIVATSIVFLLGSFLAWFLWIKVARVKVLHVPEYHPPFLTLLAGLAMIALLALAAYAVRKVAGAGAGRSGAAPSPWIVGIVTIVFGFPWYVLMGLVFAPRRGLPLWIPVAGSIAWACLAFVVARWVSRGAAWGDMHRWAAAVSAALVGMVAGFLGSGSWPRMDFVFKVGLNVVTVALLVWLAAKIARRTDVGLRGSSRSE